MTKRDPFSENKSSQKSQIILLSISILIKLLSLNNCLFLEGYKEILSPDLRKIRAKEIWEKYCTPLSNYEINIEGKAYNLQNIKFWRLTLRNV